MAKKPKGNKRPTKTPKKGSHLSMRGVDPKDALRAFMQVDPDKVKARDKAERAGRDTTSRKN
jgi:hypothetical protein